MIGKYAVIRRDLFDIAARLKEIDSGYYVLYSYKKARYEVHNRFNRGHSFCVAVPYKTLDARTLTLVSKTASGRANSLFKEVSEHNDRLMREESYKAKKQNEKKLETVLSGF